MTLLLFWALNNNSGLSFVSAEHFPAGKLCQEPGSVSCRWEWEGGRAACAVLLPPRGWWRTQVTCSCFTALPFTALAAVAEAQPEFEPAVPKWNRQSISYWAGYGPEPSGTCCSLWSAQQVHSLCISHPPCQGSPGVWFQDKQTQVLCW